MSKHYVTELGSIETARNGKEYYEVSVGRLNVGDEIYLPAVEGGVPSRRKSKGLTIGRPEVLFAVVEGLGEVFERKISSTATAQFQRAYVIRK